MFLNIKKRILLKTFITVLSLGVIVFIYKSVSKYMEPLNQDIIRVAVSDIIEISDHVATQIIEKSDKNDFLRSILNDKRIKDEASNILQTMQTSNIKYVYIVFKTKEKYRYLLDVSADEQSESLEIFEPINPERWDYIYNENMSDLIHHKNNDAIGFTYLKPIIIAGKVKAILAIDYSHNKLKSIKKLKNELELIILSLLTFVLLFLITGVVQTYRTIFLKEKMNRDELTTLYNRHFLKSLEEHINFDNYYILLLDIDLFKRVNDSYGHNAGDYVLRNFSKLLKDFKGKNDYLIRHGGEEFLFFIKKGIFDIEAYANKIRVNVQEHKFIYEELYIPISISIGLYLNNDNAKTLKSAIHQADLALYEAKRTGRNKVVLSSSTLKGEMNPDTVRDALENNLLFCEYQSIVDVITHDVSHYEALVRIKGEDEILYPDSFLHSIENTFLYTKVTKKIILLNIEKLKEYDSINISINFSPEDLLDDSVLELLHENKQYAPRILIEILETQNISYNLLNESLVKLKEYGYKICIDDFGSGYSNFIHILQMDIDYLKLDANLIQGIAKDYKTYTIVESIVLICKKNNIYVIAEYVENREILECLKELEVHYAQGYYFSKPKSLLKYKI